MEQLHPAEQNDLERRTLIALLGHIHEAVGQDGAETLVFENFNGFSEDNGHLEAGVTWKTPEDELRDGEHLAFAVYSEPGMQAMRQILAEESVLEGQPLGHIELTKSGVAASFSAVVYLFDSGPAAVRLDCRVTGEDVLSEDSEACFEFADQIGLGSEWARFMFRVPSDREYHEERLQEFDNKNASALLSFLNALENRV